MDGHFGDRVDQLCKEKDITIAYLEKKLGFGNGYIRNVDKLNFRPKQDRLDALAKFFNVSPEYLLGEEHPITETMKASDGVVIPIMGRVAAGIPITAVENIVGYEEITQKMAATGEYFALRVRGDSMSPYIDNGDVVIVKQQDDADPDDIVIALVNGSDGVCKKLKKKDGAIILVSINTAYDPMIFTSAEIDSVPVKIIGKVVEIRRTV